MILNFASRSLVSLVFLAGFTVFSVTGFSVPALGQQSVPRIIQGEETSGYPSVGIVGSTTFGGFCSGTLITPTHVLTAAHCAEVILGPTDGTFELDGRVYVTSDVVIHPEFNSFTFANDIAILVLDEPVIDVEPSLIFRDVPLVGDVLTIVGFGANGTAEEGSDGTFGIKRVGTTTVDEVTESLVSWLYDDPTESNTAPGDSGGPGYIDIEGDEFIACITSGGTEPDAILGDIAFNTRVDAYATWIDLTVASTSDEEPDTDEPVNDPPAGGNDEPQDDDFWSQPFPILQLLIDLLTQLLEYLTEGSVGDGGVEQGGIDEGPSAGEEPGETPAGEEPIETPGSESPDENPECPVNDEPVSEDPTEDPAENPVGEEPADEQPPVEQPVVEEPEVEQPGTDEPPTEIPVAPGETPVVESPTNPIAEVPGLTEVPGVSGGGEIELPIEVGQPITAPIDASSGSVFDAWNRAIRMLRGGIF